ncbi:hypothetical protein R1flu_018995 [Riccia fluitans]|uniref:SBP-type domain-containing protein n=1 Tax=Riccia fluitans TaxID=41844 RepID=A0ABD1ZHF0_9MARC
MAPQHTNTSAMTSSSNNNIGQQALRCAWTTNPADWDSAPSVMAAEVLEATGNVSAPDCYGGRSLGSEWDMKITPWDWEQMSSMCATAGRGGGEGVGVHSPKTSYTMCHSPESGSIGSGSGGGINCISLPKIEPVELTCGGPDSNIASAAGANVVVERRAAPQLSSVAEIEEQRHILLLGLRGGGGVDFGEGRRRYCQQQQQHCNGGTSKIGSADAMIGLKLGRREYFEDAAVAPARSGPAPFAGCPPGKRQRMQSSGGVHVPRCQVDGCRQDLSSSKDYHRRHKVCEVHSKASRVMVAGVEQRFCQQCSRFHMLTEFEDGKRSCRRRLAGHNERRRKPQPDSAAMTSTGSSAVRAESGLHANSFSGGEGKRGVNELGERGSFVQSRRTSGSSSKSVEENSDGHSGSMGTTLKLNHGRGLWQGLGRIEEADGLACQVPCGESQQSMLSESSATHRMRTMMHNPKAHQFMLEGSAGSGLTLASTSVSNVLSTLESSSPSVSGLSDSGRALSLLSSQAWGSRGVPPSSVSLDLSSSGPDVALFDQLISEKSGGLFSTRRQQTHFHDTASTAENLFPLQPHSVRIDSREQHRGLISGINLMGSGFDGGVLALMQGNSGFFTNYGAVDVAQRPTIDLMRVPSPQSHSNTTHSSAEISALRSFESFESLL